MECDDLTELIYVSSAKTLFGEAGLTEILAHARFNNAALDVTGMLVYHEGSFLQVLEGRRATLQLLFDKIKRDARHSRVLKLMETAIIQRSFADWSMGFVNCSTSDLMRVAGCNDFFAEGNCLENLDPGRAKTILQSFRTANTR